jgi:hypothetical protein
MAFLANEMGLWDGREFDDRNILRARIRPETESTAVPFIWPLDVLAIFVVRDIVIWQRRNR